MTWHCPYTATGVPGCGDVCRCLREQVDARKLGVRHPAGPVSADKFDKLDKFANDLLEGKGGDFFPHGKPE